MREPGQESVELALATSEGAAIIRELTKTAMSWSKLQD
jgi:hypothetical protein